MTESEAISIGARLLAESDISDPQREARLLMRAAFPRRYIDFEEAMAGGMEKTFFQLITRRCMREPMSHLLGYRDFYEHRFHVSGDALDPRPETEMLVGAALESPFSRLLDLGTGSGCILLSLLAARPDATGVGTDSSEVALDVARLNRTRLELEQRADLIESDWFNGVEGLFDLIVSNPPYIAADEMGGLAPELLYEPRMALTDEADGLNAYRTIAAGAGRYLQADGRLMVEVGWQQGRAVCNMFELAGFGQIRVLPDLDGRDRVVSGVWSGCSTN